MSGRRATAVTLKALVGEPLSDAALKDMIVATAHAIAERQGIPVLSVTTTAASISVTLECGRIEAVGFAVELRRLTTTWYTRKYGEPTLWGEAPNTHEDDDEGEGWAAS